MNDFNSQNQIDDHSSESPADTFIASANQLVTHAEQLMRETASFSHEGMAALRQKLNASLGEVRQGIADARSYAMKRGREAATGTNAYVHEKPWQSIAAAALLGVVTGLLIKPPRS